MKNTYAASVAVALGLLTLSGASFQAAAKSNGLVSRPSHPVKSILTARPKMSGRHGTFRRLPYFGGFASSATYYYYPPDYPNDDLLEAAAHAPEPSGALACKRSQEVVKVPTWDGGTKEVRITRC